MSRKTSALILVVFCLISIGFVIYYSNNDLSKIENGLTVVQSNYQINKSTDIPKRSQIEEIAELNNISIEQAEHNLANEIIRAREYAKSRMGHNPGVHVVNQLPRGMPYTKSDGNLVNVYSKDLIKFSDASKADGKNKFDPENFDKDKNIYIRPVNIAGSGLQDADFVSYSYSGTYLTGGEGVKTEELRRLVQTPSGQTGWTGVSRVFNNHKDFGYIILDESDISAAQETVLIHKDALNAKVGKYDASLINMQDENGVRSSSLLWIEDNARLYKLDVSKSGNQPEKKLIALAESISKIKK